jgi:hypothetical protein
MESNRKAIDYFWIISRAILILMFFYPLFNVSENASLLSNIINGSSLVYIILMIIVFKDEILKKKKKNQLKLYTGVLSFVYGVLILLAMLFRLIRITFNSTIGDSWSSEILQTFLPVILLVIVLCVWMILFGIYDLRNRKIG